MRRWRGPMTEAERLRNEKVDAIGQIVYARGRFDNASRMLVWHSAVNRFLLRPRTQSAHAIGVEVVRWLELPDDVRDGYPLLTYLRDMFNKRRR